MIAPQMPWDGSFWDQPLGFYVVGVPLGLFCCAAGLAVALLSLAMIVCLVGWAVECVLDGVALLESKE